MLRYIYYSTDLPQCNNFVLSIILSVASLIGVVVVCPDTMIWVVHSAVVDPVSVKSSCSGSIPQKHPLLRKGEARVVVGGLLGILKIGENLTK